MDIVIRADGGPEIGFGHLVRSSALAEHLVADGVSVTVATTTPTEARSIFPAGPSILELPSRGDPTPFCEWLEESSVDAVFTDAYPIDSDYQRAVRERAPLAVLQDDDRHAVAADLFVNGNLYAESLDYEFLGTEPETLLGPEYVFLRSEISDLAQSEPPWRQETERAIVTFGGSDMANLTPTALSAFDGSGIRVDTIVGPGFSEEQERGIRAAVQDIDAEVEVLRDPDDLPERMFEADFAVATASTTTYELLALGTPIVSCAVVDNQDPIAHALRKRDLATVIDPNSGVEEFAAAIHEYIENTALRHRRITKGRQLVDGRGARRIAEQLRHLADKRT